MNTKELKSCIEWIKRGTEEAEEAINISDFSDSIYYLEQVIKDAKEAIEIINKEQE